jgi:hypothetical protein
MSATTSVHILVRTSLSIFAPPRTYSCFSASQTTSTIALGIARTFHELLPGSELFLISGARHFVQLDKPWRG